MDVQADALRLKPSTSPVHLSIHQQAARNHALLRTALAENMAPWPQTDLSREC